MIVYHASTVKIDKFYIPYGGLHLGGVHSALEAALRKLRSPNNVVDADTVYLHKCRVNLGRITSTNDAGGDESWREIIDECKVLGFDSVQYKNEYEPDVIPSFMIWNPEQIEILEVDVMHMDDAEMKIEDFLEEAGLVHY